MYCGKMAAKMEEVIGYTTTELDGRFKTVRTAESNLGNFVCDIMRLAMDADVCLVNGGALAACWSHKPAEARILRCTRVWGTCPSVPAELIERVNMTKPLPLSCTTATACQGHSGLMQSTQQDLSGWLTCPPFYL